MWQCTVQCTVQCTYAQCMRAVQVRSACAGSLQPLCMWRACALTLTSTACCATSVSATAWRTHASQAGQRDVTGRGCTWAVLGLYLGCTWVALGLYSGCTWVALGLYLGCTWVVLGLYLGCTGDPLLASGAWRCCFRKLRWSSIEMTTWPRLASSLLSLVLTTASFDSSAVFTASRARLRFLSSSRDREPLRAARSRRRAPWLG